MFHTKEPFLAGPVIVASRLSSNRLGSCRLTRGNHPGQQDSVTRTSGLGQLRRGFGLNVVGWWQTTTLWLVVSSFFIALASVATVLVFFGPGTRGTMLGLQVTGRWSFLLFWFAYAGSATATLFGPRFAGLARRGRDLGLGFASAQLVHVGLVLWLYHIATEPIGAMIFFWVGVLCTYLLTIFSLPQLRDALGLRVWRISRTIALEYIALVFASDFIFLPLHAGYDKYPPSYLPFAFMLVSGVSLRFAAFVQRWLNSRRCEPSR
jgi:hypothetical protein